MSSSWPTWSYFPRNEEPPAWVAQVVTVFHGVEAQISTLRPSERVKSDQVLKALEPGLRGLGFEVETGKATHQKVYRPVLFGENGVPTIRYEVDGAHDDLGIVLEVEAGRGAQSNAAYRDLIRASLIVSARQLVLAMPLTYRFGGAPDRPQQSVAAYRDARETIEAIYASRRLPLPFEGVLLIGY